MNNLKSDKESLNKLSQHVNLFIKTLIKMNINKKPEVDKINIEQEISVDVI